jgi:hypothetical protein
MQNLGCYRNEGVYPVLVSAILQVGQNTSNSLMVILVWEQGYLDHKKQPLPRTLW